VASVLGHAHAGIAWVAKIADSGIIEMAEYSFFDEADMSS
jgi:hypothetical protein